MRFRCPYLGAEVELTDERQQHIIEHHPDLFPDHAILIADTLADPDIVRKSARFGNAKMFSKWFADRPGGKHIIVIVVTDSAAAPRHWIITTYMTRSIAEGEIEWRRG